ncbi:hypothetical protein P3342_002661 [Pyrenophora teres f. teres]|uniref:DUF2423 multi-domain protein n=1 Tax=Pyrenophora teres f. teres TaxID=97479 RepID=A0A6S6VQT1_9PLEO|nr:hypothetical protein HRS9139_01340 [Pyrenophora teres f. teres]CAA9957932.1 DUF2423 multi-domain protein [Pyrenophora teres f. maculata]KAE8850889.1 hypothetical protein PTNB85_01305 [Pyrenophora teres f. teres]KAE8851079.1 hypothetical protein HRS9122_01366 [Pyrenophora teres f. teres]KAE8869752.1 hypothetical protein PTNB29_00096 [Pyrenophora teres f. teres]
MAKGARASSKKANRTKLRARVFGPVEAARAERLHAKLLETIQQPKPEQTQMDTAEDTNTTDDASKEEDLPKDMHVDGAVTTTSEAKNSRKNKDKSQSRKQLRRKPQNKVSFPASRGKGALKPFTGGRSGGRVSKRPS